MYPHHRQSIQNVTEYFGRDPQVLALLLGGSIAHGFESRTSDIDIMIFLSEEDHQRRSRTGDIHFYNKELCTYEGGYVDGKYLSLGFLEQVAAKGSEPARFAFAGSRVLLSRVETLAELICRIAEYPVSEKAERIQRFYAQFEAWHWYCGEALAKGNRYLLGTAVSKMTLFGGRLILAHNEILYPYHKWFLKVLEGAKDKPDDLMACVHALHESPTAQNIEAFYERIKTFQPWSEDSLRWPARFMLDSELNWMDRRTPVDDL
ncbi:MAG TPA: nucleotidyltransferase domain-containing protein [Anaerolineales bacterium]|nr:nucleotidyltransferase domain-containing protein [Anaerolineales bacterium]